MAYNPNNANGSATSANSAPVVIASDQALVAVKGSATGSAVPATAFYMAGIDAGGTLQGLRLVDTGDGVSAKLLAAGGYLYNGASNDRARTPNKFIPFSGTVITSETTIWTPTSGKKFRIMGYVITTGVLTGAITVRDNTAGSTILIIPQNTIGVVIQSPPMGNGILSAAANNVLTFQGATAETVTGYVFGTEE